MAIDLDAAGTFILTHARLLERQLLALRQGAVDPDAVLAALLAYRNPDGGFGHALEPDVRSPNSETTATLTALELFANLGLLGHPAAQQALRWPASVIHEDGSIPFALPESLQFPRAPWMEPAEGQSHLTFGFAAVARRANCREPWAVAATQWCWKRLAAGNTSGYMLKYALAFLDAHADDPRTAPLLDSIRESIGPDGCIPVPGGTEDEKLTPLTLSPLPGAASRALFTGEQIQADLRRLMDGQQEDGGWTFDWLEWCPAQGLDWRGIRTVQALEILALNPEEQPD